MSSNLYYRNLPEVPSDKAARAIKISTDKTLTPFFNYYLTYRKHETEKVFEVTLKLIEWNEFFVKYDLNNRKNQLESKLKTYGKVPQELREIRKFIEYRNTNNLGLYMIDITDETVDDEKALREITGRDTILSLSRSVRTESKLNYEHISRRYDVIVMKIFYNKKGGNEGSSVRIPRESIKVYYKPNVKVLNLLINALEKLQNTPAVHNRPLLKLFENRSRVRFEIPVKATIRDNEWLFLTDQSRSGNDLQREFVKMAIETPDFAILDGPPGSGKTTTILELIYQLVIRGQKILMVGSTHAAVDNVIEKLMDPDFSYREALDDLVLPIRIGNPEYHSISDFAADYTEGELWKTKRAEQLEWLASIQNKTESQEEFEQMLLNKKDSSILKFSVLRSTSLTCATTAGITNHSMIRANSNGTSTNKPFFDFLILDEASKTTFQEFLIPALYAKKFIIIGDVLQLSPFVDEDGLSSNIGSVLDFSEEQRYWATVVNNFFQINASPKRALILYDHKESNLIYDAFRGSKYNIAPLTTKNQDYVFADIIFATKSDLKKYHDLLPSTLTLFLDARTSEGKSFFVRDSKFIPITNNLSHFPILYQYRINFVQQKNKERKKSLTSILHIRSQDDTWADALSWRLIRLNEIEKNPTNSNEYQNRLLNSIINLLPKDDKIRKKIENEIGDMYEIALPSILKLLQEGLGETKFRPKSDITTTLSSGLPEEALKARYVRLTHQNRMHPDISKFARETFYENQALHDSNRLNRGLPLYPLYNNKRMVWIDVVNKTQSDPTVNKQEINRVFKELIQLLKYLQRFSDQNWSIAVLTFYKRQRRELLNEFDKNPEFKKFKSKNFYPKNQKNIQIKIDVVDSFQGQEADFVFLSMVRTFGIGFLDNPNRLNVALTRAKYQLVILGDNKHFKKQTRSAHLKKLAEIPSERGITYDN